VNKLLRLLSVMWRARRATPLAPTDVGRVRFRVLPTDLDLQGHMDNGVHLSLMDLGRIIKARFLKKSGGLVPIPELAELFGMDPLNHPLPAWLAEWSSNAALPSRRDPAPSVWE